MIPLFCIGVCCKCFSHSLEVQLSVYYLVEFIPLLSKTRATFLIFVTKLTLHKHSTLSKSFYLRNVGTFPLIDLDTIQTMDWYYKM